MFPAIDVSGTLQNHGNTNTSNDVFTDSTSLNSLALGASMNKLMAMTQAELGQPKQCASSMKYVLKRVWAHACFLCLCECLYQHESDCTPVCLCFSKECVFIHIFVFVCVCVCVGVCVCLQELCEHAAPGTS